jgi:diguanylate cyclase (GGDEF)-like protein
MPGGEMARVADRIRLEVNRVLEISWFHLELMSEDDNLRRHWRAGPDGQLEEGWPRPSEKPPPLPGIHRRAEWQLIDRVLETHGQPLARLRLWCDPRRLGEESLELFELLLPHLAQSVERSLLEREAKHDTLTGMSLRRVLEHELQSAFEKACAAGDPLAVVVLDLDHFKRINDTWGHAAGDRALRQAARVFAQGGRDTDLCCRFGGEEFALLLRGTDGAEALRVAERHRECLEAARFEHEGESIVLTVSAGVAAFPESDVRAGADLLELADQALYAAKESGRNRCLLYRGPERFSGVRSGSLPTQRQPSSN